MKLLPSMLLATALVTCSGLAMAQPDHDDHGWHDQDHGRGHGHGHDRGDDRGDDHGDNHGRGRDHDRYDDRDRYYGRYDDDRPGHGHGPGRDWVPPGHRRWERGHRYDGPIYVVHDYRSYHLRQPPRGYHWVRDDDGQYLLVAITTGIILDMVLH